MKFEQDKFDAHCQKVFKTAEGQNLLEMLVEVYVDVPLFAVSHAEMCLKEGRRDVILMLKEKANV